MDGRSGVLRRGCKALALGLLLAAGWCGVAQASLVTPITVSLFSPGGTTPNGVDVSPFGGPLIVSAGSSGIVVGDGSTIGDFMLPGESIQFSGNSILLHVAAGAELGNGDLMTGFLGLGGEHARYVFDDLEVAGKTIVGANIVTLGGVISGVGGGLTGSGQVSFLLSLIHI